MDWFWTWVYPFTVTALGAGIGAAVGSAIGVIASHYLSIRYNDKKKMNDLKDKSTQYRRR